MAVPEQTPYIEHTGNGATTSFSLGFQCESKDHLIVLVDEIEPPIATWSLTGGNVVFTTAPASGKKIVLQRNTAMSRTTNYQGNNNSFRPETINKDIDRVWLKLQELGVADMLLKIYVDRLHGEQKDYIDNKDQLVRNIIGDLRNYVNQQDNQRNSYFENLISRQGVSLQQLDSYYNYLMQRLAQIAVDKGWEASFVVDASGKNQQDINNIINERLNRGSSDLLDFIPKSQWSAILSKTSITDVSTYVDLWLSYGKTSGKVLTAPTGLFIVSKIHLIDSVSVVCNGIGKTEFKLKDNVSSTVAEAFDLFRLTGDNPTAEKFTVDGNRGRQTWSPIGSANYGLASLNATGSPFVRDVETKNVTANGLGHPVGNDPTKWINCKSHGNGKKGFHSGAVFGSLILGGEYFNNALDSGIGMHQGMNGGRIYLAKIYNNGIYGVAFGSTVSTSNIASRNEISGCEMWGNSTCDIFVASNNSLTDPNDLATVCHVNVHDNDLRSEYALIGRFAKYVTIHDNQIHGGRMWFQNPLSTYVRSNTFINCPSDFAIKAEGLSGKTGDDFHTIGNIFNGTSCTSPIVVSGVTRYKTRGNEFNFSGVVNYPVRIYDNLDTATINENVLVRLNAFNAQFGVNDFLGIRHIKSNAKPTVVEGFKVGDICYSTNPNTSGVMGWVFDGTLWNGLGLRADKITGLSSTSTTADVVAALKFAGFAI